MRDKFTQLLIVEESPRKRNERGPCAPKTCVVCGSQFERRPTDSRAQFRDRKACSRKCSGRLIANSKIRRATGRKHCAQCGAVMVPRPGERPWKFANRATCSIRCGHELSGRRKQENLDLGSKPCATCGKQISRRDDERRKDFVARQTCSPDCARKLAFKDRIKNHDDPKPCAICGTMMERRDNELRGAFTSRQTCSPTCRQRLISRNSRERKTRSPYPFDFNKELKVAIRARDGNKCAFCDSSTNLHVHHIDYRKHDCHPENLLTLCRSCHMKTNHGDRSDWYFRCRAILVARGVIVAEELAA